MRGKNLIQVLKAIDLLSRRQGTTKKQLSEKLKIENRAVSRLLKTLEELGFPIYDDKDAYESEKVWKLESTYLLKLPNINIPDLNLSYSEIISLYLLKGESNLFGGTEIEKYIDTAFSKFNICMPKETKNHLNKLKQIVISKSEAAKNYSGKEEIVNVIVEAIIDQKICKIKYDSYNSDETKEYNLNPLHLFENKGGLYFFAFDKKAEIVKVYAIERIHRISKTENNFDYPDNFSPHEKLNSAFDMIFDDPIHVKIWFSQNISRYIKERKWASNQIISENFDGSIIFQMETSGKRDVKRWVMSYGIDAKLIEPVEMKKEIENEIKEMVGGNFF